jgi:hypothetical protein
MRKTGPLSDLQALRAGLRLAHPAVIDRRYRNLNLAPFALDPRKNGRFDRRINFAFPYCQFGLLSGKKSLPVNHL